MIVLSPGARDDPRLAVDRPITTIGFFDGLHKGHQSLLRDLRTWAGELGGTPTVMTFSPHPQQVLTGSAPPHVLSLDHRLLLLEREGVAATCLLEFTHELAGLSPEEFVDQIVKGYLGSHHLLLGFDSTVGHRRLGTYEYLQEHADQLDVTVRQASCFLLGGERISSTLVRHAVQRGDLDRVVEITGRSHAVLGEVVHGDHRGQSLGFPTANLRIKADAVVPSGVYFARAGLVWPHRLRESGSTEKSKRSAFPKLCDRPALVNIGRRPTFTGDDAEEQIEVHLLDFTGDLYGAYLEVAFLKYHRGEQTFTGVEALVAQIRSDEAAMRTWLKTAPQ